MGTCLGHCFGSNPRRHEKCHSLYCSKTDYVQFGALNNNSTIFNRQTYIPSRCEQTFFPSSLSSIFSMTRRKEQREGHVSLELIENSCSLQFCDRYVAETCVPYRHHLDMETSSDQAFQCLDAKALVAPSNYVGFTLAQENKSLNTTPPSSLDLEWEHEALCHPRSVRDEEEDSDSTAATSINHSRNRPYYKSLHARACVGSRQGSLTQDSSTGSKEGSRMTTPDSLEWDFVDSSIPTIDQETEQLIAEIERLAANALEETGNYSLDVQRGSLSDGDEN
ncbi:uncharacterized protein LOC117647648 [Thrips palmi]|uniref:Uncharacterized protein LOC117647648 n=1 Tax=Thrips palmi TaxID=161013 RepID=A0A6P8ZBN6_THRPL|nr:uncharacterized protein LOC117647648 [Thrips palmi]